MTPSPDINNLVDPEARIAARQAELATLTAEKIALNSLEPNYIAQEKSLREHRDRTLKEISERYDNKPSFIGRWFNKLGF